MKFYRAENAARIIGGQRFNIYDTVAGTAVGVLATEDPEVIASLDEAMKDPRQALSVISSEDYDAALKKKVPGSEQWRPLSPALPTQNLPLKGRGAVVVESRPPKDGGAEEEDKPISVEVKTLATVDEIIEVHKLDVPVAAPDPVEPAKSNRFQKRK